MVVATVTAINAVDPSDESAANSAGALIETVPSDPTVAPSRNSNSDLSNLYVDYTALTTAAETGGATIDSYSLEQKLSTADDSTYAVLVGFSPYNTATQYHWSSGFTAGLSYTFRYRARNAQGWSGYSPTATLLIAQKPDQMAAVSTSMNGANVKFNWLIPTFNNSPIIAYRLKVLQSDASTLTEQTTYCDGTDATIKSNLFCEIPMSVLTASPYSLAQGTKIQATVEALNGIDYS